jgi:serpin B
MGKACGLRYGPWPFMPVSFRADHPFLFVIRDNHTGSIMFQGRMVNPGASIR